MANTEQMSGDAKGRYAESVTQIPVAGWKEILKRTIRQVSLDNVSLIAGGATFFLVLAIFPALASFVALYGLFFDPAAVARQMEALGGVLPTQALDLLTAELERLTSQPTERLGLGFVAGLLLSLWSANAGMKALFSAMNVAYDEDEKRGFIRLTLTSLGFTIAGLAAVVVLIVVVGALPTLMQQTGLGPTTQLVLSILRWPMLLLFVMAGFAVLYKYGPSRSPPKWKWISWGTAFTAILWIVVSALFAFYLSNFANYNATYGSLGAVIGFMMWLYVSLMVLLVGAELNSEIEHQVAVDTTSGPYKPMGRRGAVKADSLPTEKSDDDA